MEFDRQKLENALAGMLRDNPKILHPAILSADGQLSLHLFERLNSTNETLWDLLEQGAGPGTVVIALQQNAGKGQWGRQWLSAPGGLYLSMAIAPQIGIDQAMLLTISSAWGIAQAYRDRLLPVEIKWPNDLILAGRKLGGILTETKIYQERITKAVIGVGINWTNPVPETGINLQSYFTETVEINHHLNSIEMLAACTLQGLICGYQQAFQDHLDPLLKSYQELLTSIGRLVRVEGNQGVVLGITPTGELRVQLLSSPNPNCSEIYLKPGTISLGYDSDDLGA